MSLVSLVVPIGKQYKFVTAKSVADCLNDLRVQLKPAKKNRKEELEWPLEGTISVDSFVVHRNFDSALRRLFSPAIRGVATTTESGTVIRVITAANSTAASIINSSLSTLLGALIGLGITVLLVPNMVPRFYAFVWTAVIPFVVALISALMARIFVGGDCKFIMNKLAPCFNGGEAVVDSEPWTDKSKNSMASQQLIAGSLSCLLSVSIAYFTNSMIVGCWNRGQYDKVESFCRPVSEISEAILGPDNIVAAQSRFQLAEALRCETPPKFKEAVILYERTIDSKDKSLKDNPVTVANNQFSLGRVLDQTGRHVEADKLYREAVDKWENAKEVGPKSIILARALDRLSMLCLKEHKYDEAEKFENRALEIDRALGDTNRSVGEDLNDLALVYDQQEKYKEAESLYKEAIAYKNKHLDPVDYSRATSLYNLAEIEKILGDEKQFADLSTQAYAIWKKLLHFRAQYSPKPPKHSDSDSESTSLTIEAPTGFQDAPVDNPKVVPDPISCYLRILKATKQDYELPHLDTRFDGLRPYLGRQ